MLVLVPLSQLIFWCLAESGHSSDRNHVRAGILLPNIQKEKDDASVSVEDIMPVLDLAIKDSVNRSLRPPGWLSYFHHGIGDCSDQKTAAHAALAASQRVNIVLGPTCDYMVATAIRILSYKDIPMLTPGAATFDFRNKTEYEHLTRLGAQHDGIIDFLQHTAREYSWRKLLFSYETEFWHSEALNQGFCRLLGNGMYYRWEVPTTGLRKTNTSYLLETAIIPKDPTQTWIQNQVGHNYGVILLCASPDTVRKMMLAAADLGMVDSGEYVFINIDVSTGSFDARPWYRENDTQNEKARTAYRAVKTISLRRMNTPDYKIFQEKVRKLAHNTYKYKEKTGKVYQMNNFISSFYDAVLLYAIALNETLESGGNIRNGTEITQRMWNRTFQGITGEVSIDSNGDRFSDYSLLDLNPTTGEFELWEYTRWNEEWIIQYSHILMDIIVATDKGALCKTDYIEVAFYSGKKDELEFIKNKSIHWVKGRPPTDVPVCGYDRAKCPEKGLPTWAWSLIALLIITIIFSTVSLLLFRHYRLEAELSAMSWRIRWEELSGEERRKERSKHVKLNWIVDQEQLNPLLQRQDSRASLTKSTGSEETIQNDPSQQIFTKTASYKGAIVAIKKLNINKPKLEMNRTFLLEFKKMKDIQNDHITRFIGACIDAPHYCLVTEYCPKGSLQGMDFIHGHNELKSHGKLKSSNCVVDSRFVLKLTDLGFNSLYAMVDPPEDETESSHSYWRKKLWTAPELLRSEMPPLEGTQKGDVYSFAVVLHEMLYRQGVFFLASEEDMEPREIVERVKIHSKHPFRPSMNAETLCDPVLEKLAERCWAENPHDRPDFPAIRKIIRSLNKEYETANIVDNLLKRMEQYANNLEALVDERTADYMEEKQKVENLLHQLLPRSVATSLISGEPVKAEAFDQVTIYFSDIVGFTSLSAESTPLQVVNLLNDLYTMFDAILEEYDVYKVETIGDAYMVVSGLPERIGDRHASEIAKMSLGLLKGVKTFKIRHKPDAQLKLRIGLHSGSVVAGVVGSKMPRYCLFGDTVNTASRMESNGLPLKIHVSSTCRDILAKDPGFELELRGEIEMKGKGLQTTYWLLNYSTGDK